MIFLKQNKTSDRNFRDKMSKPGLIGILSIEYFHPIPLSYQTWERHGSVLDHEELILILQYFNFHF